MTQQPPTEHALPEGLHVARSLVLVNTGDGKGKSTRGVRRDAPGGRPDWKVAVVQFLKSGEWHVGEEKVAKRLGVDWWALGEGFTWDSEDLTQDQAVARGGLGAGPIRDRGGCAPAGRPRRDHLPDDVGVDRHRRRWSRRSATGPIG